MIDFNSKGCSKLINVEKYLKGSKWSGVISLGLGTIIGQIINLLIQPLLTRFVSPEDLGTYTFIISMANLIIPVASLKLYMLIVVDKDDDNADELTLSSIFTVIIVSIIYLVFIFISNRIGNNAFSEIGLLSYLIPLLVIMNGIRFVLISYNNRYKDYSAISKTEILREISKGLIQVLSAFVKGGAFGQVLGYGLSPIIGMKLLCKKFFERMKYRKKDNIIKLSIKHYKKYKKHILYLVPAQFINSYSYAMITMTVVELFSTAEAGYYSISVRVLGLPLVLITNNVSKVFLQAISEEHKNKKTLWDTYIKIIKVLAVISVLGFGILAIIAPRFAEFIFGKGYNESGIYITILSTMYAVRFIASSISGSFVVINKQSIDTLFQILLVSAGILAYFLTRYLNLNIYQYLQLISISYGIIYLSIIVTIGILFKKLKYN